MKILITGGTGFIGSRLALQCKERGDDVKVLGLANTPAEEQNTAELKRSDIDVIPVDVKNKDGLSKECEHIDVVYHLAAAQHEMNVADNHFRDINVDGTRNVIDASIENGVKRFVHGSTIGVYGIVDGRIDEDTKCNPENIYGVTKLEGERLALSYKDKLPVVIFRIPEVYGPGDRRLLKLFKIIQKNQFFMIGSGKNLHHLIYIDDLIKAFHLAVEKDDAVGEVFQLAGEKPITTDEMVFIIAKHLGAKGSIFRVPFGPVYRTAAIMESVFRPLRIQPPIHRRRMDFFKKSYDLSWEKAARLLDFYPQTNFSDGVLKTARWYADMGFIDSFIPDGNSLGSGMDMLNDPDEPSILPSQYEMTAKIEPFDSFWEAPEDVAKGYDKFATFYKHNYLSHFPHDRQARILDISCGPGYMINLLNQNGYMNVIGIDAMPQKVSWAKSRNLNCMAARAIDFLHESKEPWDVIFCEQEINHLSKNEILDFLQLCRNTLNDGGRLIIHSLNGANPLVGSENLALNYDHYNTFTEKSIEQVLEHVGFRNIRILPLKLYVFYRNPLNYVGIAIDTVLGFLFKYVFKFYGKSNSIFTKKIAAVCTNPGTNIKHES